jgi:hypothetical protein
VAWVQRRWHQPSSAEGPETLFQETPPSCAIAEHVSHCAVVVGNMATIMFFIIIIAVIMIIVLVTVIHGIAGIFTHRYQGVVILVVAGVFTPAVIASSSRFTGQLLQWFDGVLEET